MAAIRKLKSGKHQLDYYDSKGIRQRINFDSRREAEEAKRVALLGGSDDEDAIEPKTLKEAIRFYHDNVSKGKKSLPNETMYFKRLYTALRKHGIVMVHDIKAEHLELFKVERLKTCKPSTVNREFNTYRHFFTKSLDWKWIRKNPCEKVSTVPAAQNPRRVWTDSEFEAVVSKVPRWAARVLTFMNQTGAGPAEIARVTWADVDFANRRLLIKRYKGSGEEFRRHLHLTDDLLAFMVATRADAKMCGLAKQTDRVFLNSKRNPIDARPLATLVRRAVRFHGLPEGTVPYGIRHKVATELLEAGVGEETTRKLLGHQSVRTLIENYAHVREPALKEAMNVREKQIKGYSRKGREERET